MLIVVLTISLLGATMVALFYNALSEGQTELYRAQALYLAEAGIARTFNMLRSQAGVIGGSVRTDQVIPPTSLGEGTYEVYANFAESTIVSIGTSHGVSRTLQIKYNAF